jgi:hypothetical protein
LGPVALSAAVPISVSIGKKSNKPCLKACPNPGPSIFSTMWVANSSRPINLEVIGCLLCMSFWGKELRCLTTRPLPVYSRYLVTPLPNGLIWLVIDVPSREERSRHQILKLFDIQIHNVKPEGRGEARASILSIVTP